MSDNSDIVQSAWRDLLAYLKLRLENLKLVSTEKSAILMSACVVAAVLGIMLAFALLFISIGLVLLLATAIPGFWCFMIMGAVYVVLALVVYCCRQTLVTDPIARFMSRLLLDHPDAEDHASTGTTH